MNSKNNLEKINLSAVQKSFENKDLNVFATVVNGLTKNLNSCVKSLQISYKANNALLAAIKLTVEVLESNSEIERAELLGRLKEIVDHEKK